MKILVVGGAGHVGSILLPGLQREHETWCFDLSKVESLGDRSIVGNVNDEVAIGKAVAGMGAIVYLAMGTTLGPDGREDPRLHGPAFDVNIRGAYVCLREAFESGVRRFVYASSLSVYENLGKLDRVDETVPADSWVAYGMSKRLAERLCEAAADRWIDATIIALRLIMPQNDAQFKRLRQTDPCTNGAALFLGPMDVRRLFLAAVQCSTPGAHIVQATGDVEGDKMPNEKARAVLGWQPRGE